VSLLTFRGKMVPFEYEPNKKNWFQDGPKPLHTQIIHVGQWSIFSFYHQHVVSFVGKSTPWMLVECIQDDPQHIPDNYIFWLTSWACVHQSKNLGSDPCSRTLLQNLGLRSMFTTNIHKHYINIIMFQGFLEQTSLPQDGLT